MFPAGAAASRALIGQLATFLAVFDTRNFRAAGEAVGRSQPAVTAQIAQLEALLGVTLFLRTTRMVEPTLAGRELAPRARRLVADAAALLRDFQTRGGVPGGRLALSVSPTVAGGLAALALRPFRLEFPDIPVTIREDMADAMFQALIGGVAEIGVGPYAEPPSPLTFTPVFEQPFYLLAPKGHPLTAGRRAAFRDFASAPQVLPSRGTTARALLERTAANFGLTLSATAEATEFQTIAAMVAAGLGLAAMPRAAPETIDALGLTALPFADAEIVRPIGVIAAADASLTPPANAFRDLLRLLEGAPERLADIGLRRSEM